MRKYMLSLCFWLTWITNLCLYFTLYSHDPSLGDSHLQKFIYGAFFHSAIILMFIQIVKMVKIAYHSQKIYTRNLILFQAFVCYGFFSVCEHSDTIRMTLFYFKTIWKLFTFLLKCHIYIIIFPEWVHIERSIT